jgi:thiol-disulfide isomerase/thioredoxin
MEKLKATLKKYHMKRITTILITFVLIIGCTKQKEVDIEFITKKFNERMKEVDQVQYDVRNIMDFSSGTTWDNEGFAVLERDAKDAVFGFSFYGIRNDIKSAAIYKDGIGFDVSKDEKSFEQYPSGLHFFGTPGGQMIYSDFFQLEAAYDSINISETDDRYVLTYTFEDDLVNKISQRTKIVELNKGTFLPARVVASHQPDFGQKQKEEFLFTNVKINQDVEKNLNAFIEELNQYEQIVEEEQNTPNPLLKKPLPTITLTDLFDENNAVTIKKDQLTLIDFWEVWCGWCIKAFPDVENLKNTYKDDLMIVGIVTQDVENARKLVKKKNTTFLNLIGNKEISKAFSVNSWPRCFLVDKNGIIQKEYRGFSDQIEKDIKTLINN